MNPYCFEDAKFWLNSLPKYYMDYPNAVEISS